MLVIKTELPDTWSGRWHDELRIPKYYNEFKQIVEDKGGKMLSEQNDYKTAHSKLRLSCQNGHLFGITLNNLKNGKWCPHCKTYSAELIALKATEHLFEVTFVKARPNFLKNGKSSLELDIFNEDLKLAIEYNGQQHYRFSPPFHRTEEDFERQKKRDELKAQLCKENNVNLIVVPYSVRLNKICEFIADKSTEFGYKVTDRVSSFDINSIQYPKSKKDEAKSFIENKGYKLLSDDCPSSDFPIIVQCPNGHESFETTFTKFKFSKKGGCKPCAHGPRPPEIRAKISASFKIKINSPEEKAKREISRAAGGITRTANKIKQIETMTHKICKYPDHEGERFLPVEKFRKRLIKQTGTVTYVPNCKVCIQKNKRRLKTAKNNPQL